MKLPLRREPRLTMRPDLLPDVPESYSWTIDARCRNAFQITVDDRLVYAGPDGRLMLIIADGARARRRAAGMR